MTIYISEEDTKLFQNNGFSYDDVSNTVNHYREIGLSDEEIQNKINTRISEFKLPIKQVQNEINPENQTEPILNQQLKPQEYISSYEPKTAIENFAESVKWVNESSSAAWNEGRDQVRTADLEIKDMFNTLSVAEKKELESLNNQTPHDYKIYDPDYKYGDNYKYTALWAVERMPAYSKRSYVESVKMLPLIWETMKRGGIGAGVGAAVGGTIGAARSLFTTKIDVLPSALQGASAGAIWGGRITGGVAMAEFEAGLARNELKQINREIIQEGGEPLSDAQLNALALGVGVVNGGLEMISFKRLLKTVPGGDKIVKQLEKKNLKELAKNKTVRQQLANVFKDYGKALTTETTTEMLQETSNIVAGFTAKKIGGIEDDSLPDYLKKNSARVLETGIATFGATMFLGGFGTTAKTATILTKQGMTKNQAQKTAESMSLEEKKQFISENMDTLMQTVKDIPSVQELEKREQLHENIKNDMVSGVNIEGIDDITLNDTARVFSESIANLAKSVGKNVDEVNRLFNIKYETLTDEQAIKQYRRDNTLLNGSVEKNVVRNQENIKEGINQNEGYYKKQGKFIPKYLEQERTVNASNRYYKGGHTTPKINKILDFIHEGNSLEDTIEKYLTPEYTKERITDIFNKYQNGTYQRVEGTPKRSEKVKILNPDYRPQYINESSVQEIIEDYEERTSTDKIGHGYNKYSMSNNAVDAYNKGSKPISKWTKKEILSAIQNITDEYSIPLDMESLNKLKLSELKNYLKKDGYHHTSKFYNTTDFYKVDIEKILENAEKNDIGLKSNLQSELQRKDGKTVKIEYYNNSDIVNIKPLNIRKLKFDNVQDAKRINKTDIKNAVFKKKNNIYATNKKTGINAVLTTKSLKEIISSIFKDNKSDKYFLLKKEIIANVETIFENAIPVLRHNELKNEHLYNKQIIHRFALPVQIGSNNFLTMITVKERTDYKEAKIDEFAIYDMTSEKREMLDRNPSTSEVKKTGRRHSQASITTMNDILDFVNTNLEKYKVSLNNNKNILFQSAYHGTPHRFDEFSLEHIGSGEGAQVHGYGLYLAENKDVSEGYRKKLSEPKIFINEKEVQNPLIKNLCYFIRDNGKKNATKYLKQFNDYEIKENVVRRELYKLERQTYNLTGKELDNILQEIENKEKELQKLSRDKSELATSKNIPMDNPSIAYDEIQDINENEIRFEQGQLFKVDIPESDVLLDEDKTFNEQSETVQDALRQVLLDEKFSEYFEDFESAEEFAESEITDWEYGFRGGNIYDRLSKLLGSDKEASLLLNEYGIKGITYNGYEDGRCYVIFDDKAINIIKRYYQELDNEDYNLKTTEESIKNARGFTYQKTNFDGSIKENVIVLLKGKADKSTLLHEFSHIYLNVLNVLAKDNDKAKDMLLAINKQLRYDGKEYTTQQHEKFAKMFEAYVKTGKAPTYRLKRVFEHFRKWMGDIYNGITNSNALEISPEWKKIFDELLGDVSVDVQEQISENLIEKARNYANLKISKINDSGIIHPKLLTEKQLRYRDTAYDIIFYALKHSKDEETRNYVSDINQLRMILGAKSTAKNAKGLAHQRERLELILAESDDAFSAHDGFLPEWGEFFDDPGVSYDYQIQGADAKLALEALDVIVNKKYLTDDLYSELSENDVKRAEYELEYLLDDYKNAKDKTASMAAFYMWIENQHPYAQEDFLNTWEMKTNEIERYQALDKWQQAKEDLKLQAAKMKGFGDYSTQFAEYARSIIKRLDFMSETDKSKLFDKLKDFNSFRDVERNLDEIMNYAQTLYSVSERRHLADDIKREVSRTVHEWQNGIKRTKYTYPANKLFERLRAINKMNSEEIQMLYDSMVNDEVQLTYEADKVHDDDYYKTIEKMFIEFKYNGSYYNSTAFLTDLLERIQNAKFTAKLARDEIDFERRMQQINLIDECARAVDEHRGKVSGIEKAYRHAFNLNSALEMMFNKSIKKRFSLDYLYAKRDAQVGKDRTEVINKLADIWGYKGAFKEQQLFNRFINMTKKEFEIHQRYTPDKVNGTYRITHTDKETGKQITERTVNLKENIHRSEWDSEPIELSRMEVLYYYIQSKNDVSYKILTDMGDETTPAKGQFDKYEFDNLINQLTPQEKLMGDILQMAAEKYYDELNKYHIKKYHTELGKVKNYFPRKSELPEVRPMELFNEYVQFNANQKFQKQRTAGPGIRIAPANPVAVLFDHMEKANTLIFMGEQLDLMNRVFKDSDLQKKLKNVWGEATTAEFMKQITGNLYSGQKSIISEAESWIGKIENNVIKAQIFLKPQVGLKNIISFMNYGVGDEYVSSAEWMKKFAEQTFNPKEWKNNIDYMLSIPYLADRFHRGGSTDALKRQLEQRIFAKINLFEDFLSANIRLGDIGAIILGGKPYIDCLIEKGYTQEEAHRIFIEKTINDQQSSIPSTLSNIQRSAASQPLAKMFFAYQNTPWQYFRMAMNAIIRFKQNPNKKTGLNTLKLTGLYLYVFPLIFNMASSLSPLQLITTGDDDELKNDISKSIIGGVTFIPFAGMFINTITSGFMGERASTGNWFDTAASKVGNTARKMKKGEVTALDIFYASALFGEALTGVPLVTIGTEISGIGDILQGDFIKGTAKAAGYSDYRGKKLSGEK